MRNERNQLEREAEILNQRFQQESQNLKDELRGMFDDRKMAVRMDQKAMESRVSVLVMFEFVNVSAILGEQDHVEQKFFN